MSFPMLYLHFVEFLANCTIITIFPQTFPPRLCCWHNPIRPVLPHGWALDELYTETVSFRPDFPHPSSPTSLKVFSILIPTSEGRRRQSEKPLGYESACILYPHISRLICISSLRLNSTGNSLNPSSRWKGSSTYIALGSPFLNIDLTISKSRGPAQLFFGVDLQLVVWLAFPYRRPQARINRRCLDKENQEARQYYVPTTLTDHTLHAASSIWSLQPILVARSEELHPRRGKPVSEVTSCQKQQICDYLHHGLSINHSPRLTFVHYNLLLHLSVIAVSSSIVVILSTAHITKTHPKVPLGTITRL
jgi:hypothetical protein